MATIPELVIRLEKRIMVLERLAGVEPVAETLIHPKSGSQADFRATEAAKKIDSEIVKGEST
jgi:hypothetical protein